MRELLSRLWFLDLAALALALGLSLAVGAVYVLVRGPHGIPRAFVQALLVSGVVSAMIVLSIGDSIARGVGLVGALTVIRYRTELKDPRDLMFAFAALATGVAAGAHAWVVAIAGTSIFLAASLVISRADRAHAGGESLLSIRLKTRDARSSEIGQIMAAHCAESILLRVRQMNAEEQEHAHQIRLKPGADPASLVRNLKAQPGVEDTALVSLALPTSL